MRTNYSMATTVRDLTIKRYKRENNAYVTKTIPAGTRVTIIETHHDDHYAIEVDGDVLDVRSADLTT